MCQSSLFFCTRACVSAHLDTKLHGEHPKLFDPLCVRLISAASNHDEPDGLLRGWVFPLWSEAEELRECVELGGMVFLGPAADGSVDQEGEPRLDKKESTRSHLNWARLIMMRSRFPSSAMGILPSAVVSHGG